MTQQTEAPQDAAGPATTTTTTRTSTLEGHYWERARRGAVPWIIGAVGLAALGVGQFVPLRHHMESDLRDRSLGALRAAGFGDVAVDFTGRDGRLTGTVASPSDIDRALATVRGLEGVRVASADLKVPGPVATAASPTVKAQLADGRLALIGSVGSEAARQALVETVKQAFGAGSVDDQLTVAASTSDAGLPALGSLVAALGPATTATVDLSAGRLTLTGTVPDAGRLEAAKAAAAAVTGDPAKVTNQLAVAAGTASASPTEAAAAASPSESPSASASPSAAASPSPSPSGDGTQTPAQQALVDLPKVSFETGSATLTPSGSAVVKRAAQILTANPSVNVRIEGYTDDLGDWDVNKALSSARADTVRRTLVADGIDAGRLSSFGWSEEHPKVPNTSAANRATNRRVEFVVLP